MTYKDTIRSAAVQAARHALPGIPEGLIRWQEEPQKQADPKHPNIILSTVSHVSNGTISIHQELANSGTQLTREFAQRWFWKVQVRVEGWKADSTTNTNPWRIVNRMRFGWRTLAVQAVLDDPDFPVKLVTDASEIRDVTVPVAGHRLPQYLYEVEFSYVEYDVDSDTDATLDGATIDGELTAPPELIPVELNV